MEESEEGTFHNKFLKFVKLHLLASAYGLITLVQWLCMLNWAPWEPWGTTNTIATMCSISIAISIFTIYCVVTCLSLALPQFLEWILALLLVECLTIAPSGLVIQSSGLHFAICLCAAVATSATFSLVGFGLSKHVGTGLAIVVFIWSAVAIGFIAISIFVGFLLSSLAAFYICITVAYVTIILPGLEFFLFLDHVLVSKQSYDRFASSKILSSCSSLWAKNAARLMIRTQERLMISFNETLNDWRAIRLEFDFRLLLPQFTEYLEAEFPNGDIHDAFQQAFDIFYAVMKQHMPDPEIGKRVKACVY